MSQADSLIQSLNLAPHPEGGHYAETFRDPDENGRRGAVTAIHYLLKAGEQSHWHRVDAVEIWLFHQGGGLDLLISPDGKAVQVLHLGPHGPFQGVVPKDWWQAARPVGDFALVSCIVAPAFHFPGFHMAPPGWAPG